jgi:carnitine O-acetyltransferase
LARLPIPALEQTAQRYLKSIQPLSNGEEYEIIVQNSDAFTSPQGLGTKLQQRLIEYDAAQPVFRTMKQNIV